MNFCRTSCGLLSSFLQAFYGVVTIFLRLLMNFLRNSYKLLKEFLTSFLVTFYKLLLSNTSHTSCEPNIGKYKYCQFHTSYVFLRCSIGLLMSRSQNYSMSFFPFENIFGSFTDLGTFNYLCEISNKLLKNCLQTFYELL